MSKKKGETETKENPVFSEKISDLENYYADNVLSKDLKSLYDQVQLDNADFRSNVFLKNIDILDSEIGTLDKKNSNPAPKGKGEDLTKKITLIPELLDKFEKKAQAN